jgi:hypothetical protein
VTFGTVTPTTVSVFHTTGVAGIPLEKLPLDLQECFGYDPDKAADYRKAVADAEQRGIEQRTQIQRKQAEQPSQSTPSQVEPRIRAKAQAMFPDDYVMQEFAIDKQISAYQTLQRMASVSGVPSSVLEQIKRNAASLFPDDYVMQVFAIDKQTAAYRSLH